MKKSGVLIEVCFVVLSLIVGIIAWSIATPASTNQNGLGDLYTFESEEAFVKAFINRQTMWKGYGDGMSSLSANAEAMPAREGAEPNHSETNIQVEGVDEGDTLKCDGNFIYTVSGNQVIIISAYPAEEAAIVSRIDFGENGSPEDLFIEADRLAVIGLTHDYQAEDEGSDIRPYYNGTFINIYDIAARENPMLVRTIEYEGRYSTSRKIGDNLHLVLTTYPHYRLPDAGEPQWEDIIPLYRDTEADKPGAFQPACDWAKVGSVNPESFTSFVSIVSLSMSGEAGNLNKRVIAGYSDNVYASLENVYLTSTGYPYAYYSNNSEKTTIYKFKLEGTSTTYLSSGEVPGSILNQFSMDESAGYFRIATTVGHVSREGSGSTNNIYILDKNLNMAGKLEGLASGETIYSARFLGDRGYLVTFKKVDPFFVIDLKDPRNPKVLGALKIPGYSDYLHPYDENHIIGIGKNTVEADPGQGNFAWYQGMKIAIFDVTDVTNPKEMHKVDIGDRGTDSYALSDHKAFLFDREKGLLVLPVLLAELTPEQKASGNTQSNAYGQSTFQGAYVYSISLDSGIELKGRVTHLDDEAEIGHSYYYYSSKDAVERCGYIEDILYTVSDSRVLFNSLTGLSEVNRVELAK